MKLNLNLKIINFFKKYGRKIIIVLSIWIIILVINHLVEKYGNLNIKISTNYNPHNSVMESSESVPKKLQSPIEELIGKFVENCNNKNYETAYNLLSEDCKKNIYPDIEDFKKYVDSIFTSKKIYNIQNFSNKNGVYIYTVNILNDILASGMSEEDDSKMYSEKYVIITENNELKLSIREYIGREELSGMYEDDYTKIKITSVDKKYDNVVYNLTIKNKSENYIVYSNYTKGSNVTLDTSEGVRNRADEVLTEIELYPDESGDFSLKYIVFYDDDTEPSDLYFDSIKIYENVDEYNNGSDPIKEISAKISF